MSTCMHIRCLGARSLTLFGTPCGYARADSKQEQERLPARSVDIRLINLRGSADERAYKSSAIGLAVRLERDRCAYNEITRSLFPLARLRKIECYFAII